MRRRPEWSTGVMYEIHCDECGRIGFHPSRVAAETRAERHIESTAGGDADDHDCDVQPMPA